jgi:hypothetical protein
MLFLIVPLSAFPLQRRLDPALDNAWTRGRESLGRRNPEYRPIPKRPQVIERGFPALPYPHPGPMPIAARYMHGWLKIVYHRLKHFGQEVVKSPMAIMALILATAVVRHRRISLG